MTVSQLSNIQPKRILVITLRYLGDTLLVTPLLASLRQAYPDAEIDVLLPGANVGMLEGNSDVSRLIPIAPKPSLLAFVKLLAKLFRRYDLAISTQGGDRPMLCAAVAGKLSLGVVAQVSPKMAWKRRLLDGVLEVGNEQRHAVLENLRFCEMLGIERCYRLVPPRSKESPLHEKYAVLHVVPQWRYKQWHSQGWVEVAYFLQGLGCRIVLTGSSQVAELEMIADLRRRLPPSSLNWAGKLSLSELTALIEMAVVFVGPDTGITHLAAATGVPTVALFGPTDPAKWAPWPVGYAEAFPPFESCGTQHVGNVYLMQGVSESGCVPCQLEGCDRHRQSRALCLEQLSAQTVIDVLKQIV